MPGEFLNPVGTIQVFEHVLARVTRMRDMDPKLAHRSATPGVIGQYTETMGPWRGREDVRFELPGVTQGVRAVGPEERMELGTDTIGHIVALPGIELAGHSQRISPDMFQYGGMTTERARELAAKPILDFNEDVAKIMLDVMTSGDYSGSQTNAFQWSATDLSGNTVSQPIVTDTADQVENVYAYDGQTFTHWPLRNGTQASTGHDHLFDTGAVWSEADATTQANNLTEHPNMGSVKGYVGSTVAAAVRAGIKSEYGAIESRVAVVQSGSDNATTDFAGAVPIGTIGGIEYWHMRDLPFSGSLYVAESRGNPFHLNIGQVGEGGMRIDTGSWREQGDPERRGFTHGHRQKVSAGVKNTLQVTYGEHAA